jgi:hypothetical protein
MNPERHQFEYADLHKLSFTQLFRLMAAMVHCHSTMYQEALVVGRASDCCRKRLSHPAYAAVFLSDRGICHRERPTESGSQRRPPRLKR